MIPSPRGASRKPTIVDVDHGDPGCAIVANTPAKVGLLDQGWLCDRCSEIDLVELFQRELSDDYLGSFIMNLGPVADQRQSNCHLCRALASVAPSEDARLAYYESTVNDPSWLKPGTYHLRLLPADPVLTGLKNGGAERKNGNLLAVAHGEQSTSEPPGFPGSEHSWERLENWGLHSDYIWEANQTTGFLSLEPAVEIRAGSFRQARKVDPLVFDHTLAASWISYCDENHGNCSVQQAKVHLPYLRVLDCRQRKVVDAPRGCRYVALSYVWEKGGQPEHVPSTVENARYPDFTQACLENVIEDSITVTLSLGMRYLWVDKLCISQSDSNDKSLQIGKMDLIYASSTLTIVAAAGNGPDHGLPGVNGTRRIKQHVSQHRDRFLVSTLPSTRYTLEASAWHTRGWTYQEGVLSTRRLFFTETQAFFHCRGMHCNESIELDLDFSHAIKDRTRSHSPTDQLGAVPSEYPGWNPCEFMRYVEDYSRRHLTYREDILNAFQGIFNAFQQATRPVFHFWGVPIFLTPDDLGAGPGLCKLKTMSSRFLYSLFWKSAWKPGQKYYAALSRTTAAIDIPSWSWAGWEGGVSSYESVDQDDTPFLDATIWLEQTQGGFQSLDEIDFGRWSSSSSSVSQAVLYYSGTIQVEAWTMDIALGHVEFSAEEKCAFGEDAYVFPSGSIASDGPHISFNASLHGVLHAKVECYDDQSLARLYHGNFIGLLPQQFAENKGSKYQYALVLRRDEGGDIYERVGIFRPRLGFKWNKEGKLEFIEGQNHNLCKNRFRFALPSVKRRIRLR